MTVDIHTPLTREEVLVDPDFLEMVRACTNENLLHPMDRASKIVLLRLRPGATDEEILETYADYHLRMRRIELGLDGDATASEIRTAQTEVLRAKMLKQLSAMGLDVPQGEDPSTFARRHSWLHNMMLRGKLSKLVGGNIDSTMATREKACEALGIDPGSSVHEIKHAILLQES